MTCPVKNIVVKAQTAESCRVIDKRQLAAFTLFPKLLPRSSSSLLCTLKVRKEALGGGGGGRIGDE